MMAYILGMMSARGTQLPRMCATARPQLAKADTAFQGASVGQPTEPCLGEQISARLCEPDEGAEGPGSRLRRILNYLFEFRRGALWAQKSRKLKRT